MYNLSINDYSHTPLCWTLLRNTNHSLSIFCPWRKEELSHENVKSSDHERFTVIPFWNSLYSSENKPTYNCAMWWYWVESLAKEKGTCFLSFSLLIPEHQLTGVVCRSTVTATPTRQGTQWSWKAIYKGHTPDVSHLTFIKFNHSKWKNISTL